jgi:hypothetical protein
MYIIDLEKRTHKYYNNLRLNRSTSDNERSYRAARFTPTSLDQVLWAKFAFGLKYINNLAGYDTHYVFG